MSYLRLFRYIGTHPAFGCTKKLRYSIDTTLTLWWFDAEALHAAPGKARGGATLAAPGVRSASVSARCKANALFAFHLFL